MKIPMPQATASELRKAKFYRLMPAIIIVVIVLAIIAGWRIWSGSNRIIIENARIEGLSAIISPRIAGYVREIHVADGQTVEAGRLLLQLDDQALKTELAQAESELARTSVNVPPEYLAARLETETDAPALTLNETLDKQLAAEAMSRQTHINASSELAQAKLNAERARMAAKNLRDGQAHAKLLQAMQRLESATASEKTARENMETTSLIRARTEQSIRSMRNLSQQSAYNQDPRLLDIALAEYDAARAKSLEARKNLESVVIRSPIAGTVHGLSIISEQYVERGTPCLIINSDNPADIYVIGFTNADNAGRITSGMACTLRPKNWSGPDLEGMVKAVLPPLHEGYEGKSNAGGSIDGSAHEAQGRLHPVHITISGYDPNLMPTLHHGTPCRVEISSSTP